MNSKSTAIVKIYLSVLIFIILEETKIKQFSDMYNSD